MGTSKYLWNRTVDIYESVYASTMTQKTSGDIFFVTALLPISKEPVILNWYIQSLGEN